MRHINVRILLFATLIVSAFYIGLFLSQIPSLFSATETANEARIQTETTTTTAVQKVVDGSPQQQESPEENPMAIARIPQTAAAKASAPEIYKAAKEALQNEDWEKAIQDLEQVSALDESFENDEVRVQLVNAYVKAGIAELDNSGSGYKRYEVALAQFRKAMTLAPDNEQVRTNTELLNTFLVGKRAVRLGSMQQAIDILRPIYETGPDYLQGPVGQQLYEIYLEVGDRAMRKSNVQVAIDYFGRAEAVEVADNSALEARLRSLEKVKIAIITPTPVPTIGPTVTPTPTLTAEVIVVATSVPTRVTKLPSCPDKSTVITSPRDGELVSGWITLSGTAYHEDFDYFKLEIASEFSSDYSFVVSEENSVRDWNLTSWDSRTVSNGNYKLRLTVVESDGNYPQPCEVTVKVQNKEGE